MSEWSLKRFWQNATVDPLDDAFAVLLDKRPVRTPGKRLLHVPSEAIARQIAAEWEAQIKAVDPRTMPWTRTANSAIDKVATQREAVRDYLIDYAATDLISYRAEAPAGLVERQSALWNPILDWVEAEMGVRLLATIGVMPISQNAETLLRLKSAMKEMSDFQLAGFYDLVTLSGSYVIALAASRRAQASDALWSASRSDEDWQAEQWGADEEAAESAEIKKIAFLHAASFYHAA